VVGGGSAMALAGDDDLVKIAVGTSIGRRQQEGQEGDADK
jgi:hypothetical protein